MRSPITKARGGVALAALSALVLFAACGGGGDGGGPEPTPDCEISGVNTGLDSSWIAGETVNIYWTGNGVPGTVDVDLLKGGVVVASIAAGTPNDGYQPWIASTVGQPNGSDFGIRVSGVGDAACADQIDDLTLLDTIGCTMAFSSDVDSVESLMAGQDWEITWSGDHTSGLVDIELYKSLPNSLGDFVAPIAVGTPDDGSFVWNVDSFHEGSLFYRLRITDSSVDGCEDVTGPIYLMDDDLCVIEVMGIPVGHQYTIGDTIRIDVDQTVNNGSGVVNLRLYVGETFVPGGFIADDVVIPDGIADWVVDDYDWLLGRTSFKVRAVDVNDPYCVGESARFEILPR